MSEYIQLHYMDAVIVRDLVDAALEAELEVKNPEEIYCKQTVHSVNELSKLLGELQARIEIAKGEEYE